MICDGWISILFFGGGGGGGGGGVCISRFADCERPVLGNNQLVFFEDFSDLSNVRMSTLLERIKQSLPSSLDKHCTQHLDFLRCF